jgi:hypothetical protein
MANLTFVTCFLDAYEGTTEMVEANPHKQLPERIARFRQLAATRIPICLYICPSVQSSIEPIAAEYPNIYWEILSLEDTFTWKTAQANPHSLPAHRYEPKDTANYILVQNSKIELVEKAIHTNPWKSRHFAWIDFSIFYVFHHPERSAKWLQMLSRAPLSEKMLTFPGCERWEKWSPNMGDQLTDRVYWRFCGGFFIGDRDSLLDFAHLYRVQFPIFLQIYRKLVWEVNVWAWLETATGWSPTLYTADHNDSILYLSADHYAQNMQCKSDLQIYPYPAIPDYQPASAAYIEYRGEMLLNTRYVNYLICDNGAYHMNAADGRTLDTQNWLSVLGGDLVPQSYEKMDESEMGLTDYLDRAKRFVSRGLEDIRLYESAADGRLRFIATTIQYSPLGQNRMVLGEYDIDERKLRNATLVEPPNPDVWCEKNWIPIVWHQEDHFIYSWSPFQVGKIVPSDSADFSSRLEIVLRKEYPHIPFFNWIRGSTTFTATSGRLLGVVHFSEEYMPRHYFHMLVQLDKETLDIVEYTHPFYFQNIGIEFCIGFRHNEDQYQFWISQMDRNPAQITISKTQFMWTTV